MILTTTQAWAVRRWALDLQYKLNHNVEHFNRKVVFCVSPCMSATVIQPAYIGVHLKNGRIGVRMLVDGRVTESENHDSLAHFYVAYKLDFTKDKQCETSPPNN